MNICLVFNFMSQFPTKRHENKNDETNVQANVNDTNKKNVSKNNMQLMLML